MKRKPAMQLNPRDGFDWHKVKWGEPDEARTEQCSYCGAEFPTEEEDPGFMPLIFWTEGGWCAEFCEQCQATWFGMVKP